jgi:hypothetical protein
MEQSKEQLAEAFALTVSINDGAGTAAYKGYNAGFEKCQQLLQQTPISISLTLLNHILNRVDAGITNGLYGVTELPEALLCKEKLLWAISLIGGLEINKTIKKLNNQ